MKAQIIRWPKDPPASRKDGRALGRAVRRARPESEETFRAIFENARDAYYLLSMAGDVIDANQRAEAMTGFKVGEVRGRNILALGLLSEEHHAKAAAHLLLNLRGVSIGPEIFRMSRKDGGEVWVELSSHPVRLRGRKFVLGIARDITERRLAEERLAKSEMKYRALFESASDAVFLMDLKEKTRMVNPRAGELLGYTISELLGMPFMDLIGADDLRHAKTKIRETIEKAPPPLQERVFRRKDGSEIPVEINLSLLRDENGKPLYIQRIVRDISARKKFMSDLQQSAARLRSALEGVIKAVAAMTEQRDPYTAGHQMRVAALAKAIALEMDLGADRIDTVYLAGYIHDIGKVAVPAEILSKPGALSAPEFSLIKLHTRVGFEILKDIDFPWPITRVIYQHHERLDGSGYPLGLRGEEICLEARVLAVADVVEAMASHRPYRPALGLEKALLEVSGSVAYDQRVVGACRELFIEKGYQL